jgi:hypothetical protein
VFLGDLINQLDDETVATETILRFGDIGLLMELRNRAEERGTPLGSYAAWVLRTYAEAAPPDEWTTLIGILGQAGDPGSAFLRRALTYALAAESASSRFECRSSHQ